jgi:hypothetical protein
MKIFISHSSKDSALVRQLIDLLRSALGLLATDIRCTSLPGYKLPGGSETDTTLREEVETAEVVIAVLSNDSLASHYVIFELGARWGSRKPMLPLLVPGLPANALARPLSALNALSCAEQGDLHQAIFDIAAFLKISPQPPAGYQRYISEIGTAAINSSSGSGSSPTSENVLYSTVGRDLGFDWTGSPAQLWQKIDGKDQAVSCFGAGTLDFSQPQVLNIQRSNHDGRYEVWLNVYMLEGTEWTKVSKDESMTGLRRFRIDCEAKAVGAEHTLRFVLRSDATTKWVANDERTVTSNTWTLIKIYFQIPPSEEFRLRIDDMNVTRSPSSVQIRNLQLIERISQ